MSHVKYRTNLRCEACLASVKPVLDAIPNLKWQIDINAPEKWLHVQADPVPTDTIRQALSKKGYQLLGDAIEEPGTVTSNNGSVPETFSIGNQTNKPSEPKTQVANQPVMAEPALTTDPNAKSGYWALGLIVGYILAVALLIEWRYASFDVMRAMRHFMAGFFLVFSFFKLLDWNGFAMSYGMYDLLAARSRTYALAYPLIELGLGLGYVANVWPRVLDVITLVVMLIGLAGVLNSMFSGRKVRCACLGTMINLPVSTITLTEDATMAVMAAISLAMTS